MTVSEHTSSASSRNLDRVVFVAYFLGAVVPLVWLGVVIDRFALPGLDASYSTLGLIGQFTFTGLLSLGCFLMLRRKTRQSIDRMTRNTRELASLLTASRGLWAARHESDAATTAAHSALAMTNACAAFVLLCTKRGEPPEIAKAAGEHADDLSQSLGAPLVELASLVISQGSPAICGPEDSTEGNTDSAITAAVVVPLAGEKTPLGALAVIHVDPRRRFDPNQIDSLSTLAGFSSMALQNAEFRDEQRNFFSHVTDLLLTALESHLGYHGGHGNRVAQYANSIGREMGLSEDRLQRLHWAARLHDVGMFKIDHSIPHTRKVCEKHTVFGFRMLKRIRVWQDTAPLVLHHHEWFDGTGYPAGVAREEIPLESRIIALCEVFDSMTALTSYKQPLSFTAAVEEIRECAGTQFDPDVVRSFESLVERGVINQAAAESSIASKGPQ